MFIYIQCAGTRLRLSFASKSHNNNKLMHKLLFVFVYSLTSIGYNSAQLDVPYYDGTFYSRLCVGTIKIIIATC